MPNPALDGADAAAGPEAPVSGRGADEARPAALGTLVCRRVYLRASGAAAWLADVDRRAAQRHVGAQRPHRGRGLAPCACSLQALDSPLAAPMRMTCHAWARPPVWRWKRSAEADRSRQPQPAAQTAPSRRAEGLARLSVGAARCQQPPRPRDHRAVDHAAVELRRAGRARRRPPAHVAPSPVRPGVGASAAWIGATWRGWMHSLAPKPWRRAPARGRPAARASSSSCGVTPATGAASPATRDAMASRLAACARRSGRRRCRQVEVERVVERAEDQPRDAAARRQRLDVGDAARAFDQRQHRAPGQAPAHGAERVRALRPWAASRRRGRACASSRRSSANQGDAASLMRTTSRVALGRGGRPHHCAIASRAAALARRRTASSRSSTTASAPLASALAKRSGRLPGTNR